MLRPLLLAALMTGPAAAESFRLTSADFPADGSIPLALTCEGEDRSPALDWNGAPAGTRSFALIVDDPDAPDPKAPKLTWVHWVLYNLPAETQALAANAARNGLPPGTEVALNDWKKPAWGGPCPPIGEHRYFFKLYALDTLLVADPAMDKPQLLAAMQGHILAETQLIGRYQKQAVR